VQQPVAQVDGVVLDGTSGRGNALERAIHQHQYEPVRIRGGDTAVGGNRLVGGEAGIA
jgi:hypothetical protein